jgi:hypothetical protein
VLICVVDFAVYDGNPASFWTEASVKFSEKIPVMYEYRLWLENVDWMSRYMSVWVVIDNALWCMNDRMRIHTNVLSHTAIYRRGSVRIIRIIDLAWSSFILLRVLGFCCIVDVHDVEH